MKVLLRYGLIAALIVVVIASVVLPSAGHLVERWFWNDTQTRSKLVFNSVREELQILLAANDEKKIKSLFDDISLDERVLAVGYCDRSGHLLYRSNMMPQAFSCEMVPNRGDQSTSSVEIGGHHLMASSFPETAASRPGRLVILHSLEFGEQRAEKAKFWMIIALIAVLLAGTAQVSIIALLIGRRWMQSVRHAIESVKRDAEIDRPSARENFVFGAELHHILREIQETRRTIESPLVTWNAKLLGNLLAAEMPGTQIIAVSNREPYIHNDGLEGPVLQLPASGLVAALEPVMQACGGTWVAHGSGTADRKTVDSHDCIQVPPAAPKYLLRRVWLSEEEQSGYYYGFANEGLWPLCHIAFVRPMFRDSDWRWYKAVNQKFAKAIASAARQPDPVILVQDYHFGLLPKMLRDLLPSATIVTFWHIPWPNAETFGICPWKEEIVEGLLGSSVLGFHTQFHCNNFIDTVDRFIESRIDRELGSVTLRGHETLVRPYPISIEWPPAALAGQAPIAHCRASVRRRLKLANDVFIGIGVERFDYTKGILDRFRAVGAFFEAFPHWRRRFVFVQIVAPSREELAIYKALRVEALELLQAVNNRHGDDTWQPLIFLQRHHEQREIMEFFRAADLCVVSSLHDGMNLVAKEFVASRDDEHGVLILSTFAGASRELSEAVIVNPYDTNSMAHALEAALVMPKPEQKERMRIMRDMVRTRNVHRWAGQMLLDAAEIRKKQSVLDYRLHGEQTMSLHHKSAQA